MPILPISVSPTNSSNAANVENGTARTNRSPSYQYDRKTPSPQPALQNHQKQQTAQQTGFAMKPNSLGVRQKQQMATDSRRSSGMASVGTAEQCCQSTSSECCPLLLLDNCHMHMPDHDHPNANANHSFQNMAKTAGNNLLLCANKKNSSEKIGGN